jgi:hypothetical protein
MFGLMFRRAYTPAEYFYAAVLQCYPRWVERNSNGSRKRHAFYHQPGEVDAALITWIGLVTWVSAAHRIVAIRNDFHGGNRKPTENELLEGKDMQQVRAGLRDAANPDAGRTIPAFVEQHAAVFVPAMDVMRCLGSGEIRYRLAPARQIETWRDDRTFHLQPFMGVVGSHFDDFFAPAKNEALHQKYLADAP